MIYYLYVFYPHVLLNKTCVGLSTNFDLTLTSLYIIDIVFIDRKKVIQHQIFQRILMKPSENSNNFEFTVLI